MEVAAPKGRAGLILPGVLTVVNRPVPSHPPNSFRGQGYTVALTDPACLICLSRRCSLKGIAAVEINVAPWAACLFLTKVPLGQFCVCACTCACVFVLLCSSVMPHFCFFSLWVRVNLPVYPGLKVTHSHFGTPRASTVQLRSQTDLRTSSKKYWHNLFVCCSVCGCVFKERKGRELAGLKWEMRTSRERMKYSCLEFLQETQNSSPLLVCGHSVSCSWYRGAKRVCWVTGISRLT